jgi:hypothetical protein
MTEYNKAQRACIDQWNGIDAEYCDRGIITEFLEEFNAIDPTPDPDLYVIKSYSGTYDSTPLHSGYNPTPYGGSSKGLLTERLHHFMTESLDVVEEYKRGDMLSVKGGAFWKIERVDDE